MNPLLAQFVTEGRDLLEQASGALLALERNPGDLAQLDALFRAVHTIKGASGLFEYAAFTRTVHAGEDLMDAIRTRDVAFTPEIADLILEMLDRVGGWLDDLEETEALGRGAETQADSLSARMRDRIGNDGGTADTAPAATARTLDWPAGVPADLGTGRTLHLVIYRPVETAFFTGDDPLRMALSTPDLVWIELTGAGDMPDLATLDPFLVTTGFRLVSAATGEALAEHFRYVSDEADIAALGEPPRPALQPSAGAVTAAALIETQRRLIACENHGDIRDATLGAVQEVLLRIARHEAPEIAGRIDGAPLGAAELDAIAAELLAPAAHSAPPAPPSGLPPATTPAEAPAGESGPRKSGVLRVDAERIDTLMNLTGELIVAKNAMPFLARKAEEIEGARELLREIKMQYDMVNRITEELQAAVMQIRMVPVGSVLGRFNRLVRDLSRKLGKQIVLETSGEETEADKAVVEELSDPLVHLIRNAIDHGLEPPDERRAAGKPDTGTLRLAAFQRDDSVVIEVTDDGRGIALDRVKAKALERGVVDREALERMSEEQALQLILAPGLSTKEEISDLSGRGVGMDVVAAMVRRVGGAVTVSSASGQGTTVRISLPLSMAVQRLMMIEVETNFFGVPIDSVVESQKIPASRIRRHRDSEMFLLRDRMIPLLRLRRLFALPEAVAEETVSVMVVTIDGTEIGLAVDRFHPGVDAIVKPMTGLLAGTGCYSGTALLGDGSVLLALDLPEILECHLN